MGGGEKVPLGVGTLEGLNDFSRFHVTCCVSTFEPFVTLEVFYAFTDISIVLESNESTCIHCCKEMMA